MNFPDNLLYSKEHEWVLIDGETATVGITEFAQQELGDIVYVEIDKLDEEVEENDTFGTVEAVKTVSDLYIPVTGLITEFNELLESSPEKINESPYEEGWVIKVKVAADVNTAELMDAKAYQSFIGQ